MAEQPTNTQSSEASKSDSKSINTSSGNTTTDNASRDEVLKPRSGGITKNRKSSATGSLTVLTTSRGSHRSLSPSPSRSPRRMQGERLKDAGDTSSDEDDGTRPLSALEGGDRFYAGNGNASGQGST